MLPLVFTILTLFLHSTLCLFPLEVHCKYTALHPVRYLTIRWPTTAPSAAYKRHEVRISQQDPADKNAMRLVASEWHELHEQQFYEAAVPITVDGVVEVSVWGELRGGWVLLSIVTPVNACRQYRL